MKQLIAFALALVLVLSLAACGGKAESAASASAQSAPAASQQPQSATSDESEPDDAGESPVSAPAESESAPSESAASAAGEVMDFDTGISAIPAEWQKAIGESMFGMNTGSQGDCSDSYTNKFGSVSAEDYAALIAYFDTLPYVEKLDGVYNCDWGQLQIGHNAGVSEMTISWYVN